VLAHRLMQHHGAGRGRDQRHAVLVQDRNDRLGVRCAPAQEQGQHVLLLHQLARVLGRQRGVELVVQRHQLDLLPVDAAPGIDAIDVQPGAVGCLFHARRDRAGEARRLSDQDLRMRVAEPRAKGKHACGEPD
jgi:hypothetical protein